MQQEEMGKRWINCVFHKNKNPMISYKIIQLYKSRVWDRGRPAECHCDHRKFKDMFKSLED